MSNGSRLNALAVLAALAMLSGLWLAARDGDVLSIAVLVGFVVLILIGIGVAIAVFIMYASARLSQASFSSNAAENERIMARTQQAMAASLATHGRMLSQSPGGALPAMPSSLALPQLRTFEEVLEGEVDEETI